MISRRDFYRAALGALALPAVPVLVTKELFAAKIDSVVNGVQLGAQSYSFRDRPLDACIQGLTEVGLGEVELWQGHVEPKMKRDELRKWRETVSLDEFKAIRTKFDDAGIQLYAYNYSFRDDFSDKEIERGFAMGEALGVTCLTASSTVTCSHRVGKFADEARMNVGMHNHSNMHDNEFNTPESFKKAMDGNSKYIKINLDIGHFTAAGFDPVEYISKHHDVIVTLHLKDRKKNQGDNYPFGEGDTNITGVLELLKKKKYGIPANIEYEYKGADTLVEMKKCVDYCKKALS